MFDVFLTCLFLCTLLAYRSAWRGSARAWAGVGLFTGLGVLTKSALGLFPLVVVALHTLWCGRARRALAGRAWLAPLVCVAVPLPWYVFQLASHHDAFVREHIAWLLVQRGLGTGYEASSPSSPFGYMRELAATYWPWLPLALAGLWLTTRAAFSPPDARDFSDRDGSRLVLLWLVVVLGVLSLAHEKKIGRAHV